MRESLIAIEILITIYAALQAYSRSARDIALLHFIFLLPVEWVNVHIRLFRFIYKLISPVIRGMWYMLKKIFKRR